MYYCAKLTGEDVSRYLNKIESVGFRKNLVLAPDRRSDCKCCKCLHFFMAARTAGIDMKEEITSLPPCICIESR